MCIAIYKPENVAMPSLDILENCWESNPDGFGYAVLKDGVCHLHKGFMHFKQVKKQYHKYLKDLTAYDVLLHFRIGTHGGNTPENTHPFPICNNIKTLHALNGEFDRVLIHNGILTCEPRTKNISDTGEFALRMFNSGMDNDQIQDTLWDMVGSNKIALMDKLGVLLIGDWKLDDGVYYSNNSYKVSIYATYNTYGYGGGSAYLPSYYCMDCGKEYATYGTGKCTECGGWLTSDYSLTGGSWVHYKCPKCGTTYGTYPAGGKCYMKGCNAKVETVTSASKKEPEPKDDEDTDFCFCEKCGTNYTGEMKGQKCEDPECNGTIVSYNEFVDGYRQDAEDWYDNEGWEASRYNDPWDEVYDHIDREDAKKEKDK